MEHSRYADLTVEGLLANAIPPWRGELIDKGCVALVREVTQLPVISSSPNPLMAKVLTNQWARQEILPGLP